MATKKPAVNQIEELKTKIMSIRLNIKAHQEKNTNAHKALRKELAQLLTKRI